MNNGAGVAAPSQPAWGGHVDAQAHIQGYPMVDIMLLRYGIDALGPLRGYWGTDLTDPLGKAGYRRRSAHATQEPDFLSRDDKNRVMGRRSVKVHAP